MKTMLLATVAALGIASSAFAASAPMPPQYNQVGNPFPYAAPMSRMAAAPAALDTGSQGYPRADGPAMQIVVGQAIPPNSNEGVMQTANSLPRGYAADEVVYLAGAPRAQTSRQAAVPGANANHS